MNPDNSQQGEGVAVDKLEQDLQKLTEQASVAEQPVPITPPVQVPPQVAEMPPAAPVTPVPAPVPVESNIPVQENAKKGSPLMIVAIVLALVAVLAVVAYVFGGKLLSPQQTLTPTPIVVTTPSTTPDVTTNWKTYVGSDYILKYPDGYAVTSETSSFTPEYPKVTTIEFKNATSSIMISESSNSKNLTLENALGNGPNSEFTQDILVGKPILKFTIGGVAGSGVENIAAGVAGESLDVTWINKDKIYQATTATDEGAIILRQILSTFQFIEATASGSPIVSPTTSPSSSPTATP